MGSLAEAEAEALFDISLLPPSTPGRDAVNERDGRGVEIKGTYGTSGVAIRSHPSHDHACSLIVLRLSRTSGEPHELVYNGPFALAASAAGKVSSNGQARISLSALRRLNATVNDADRIRRRQALTLRDVA